MKYYCEAYTYQTSDKKTLKGFVLMVSVEGREGIEEFLEKRQLIRKRLEDQLSLQWMSFVDEILFTSSSLEGTMLKNHFSGYQQYQEVYSLDDLINDIRSTEQ